MRPWRTFLLLSATALLVAGTAGTSIAQGMMMGRGMMGAPNQGQYPPAMNPARLPDPASAGAQLLREFCAQCHNLPGPGLHTAGEWPAVVRQMDGYMRSEAGGGMMMARVAVASNQQLAVILGYLQAHAQTPQESAPQPDQKDTSFKAYRFFCSQCHALPDPRRHSAAEWPAVVEHMNTYMVTSGRAVPSAGELQAIIGFLQKHSGR